MDFTLLHLLFEVVLNPATSRNSFVEDVGSEAVYKDFEEAAESTNCCHKCISKGRSFQDPF